MKATTKYIIFGVVFLILVCLLLLSIGIIFKSYYSDVVLNPQTEFVYTQDDSSKCDKDDQNSSVNECYRYKLGKELDEGYYTITVKFDEQNVTDTSKLRLRLDLEDYLQSIDLPDHHMLSHQRYLNTLTGDYTVINVPVKNDFELIMIDIPFRNEIEVTATKQNSAIDYDYQNPIPGFYHVGETIDSGSYIINQSDIGTAAYHGHIVRPNFFDLGAFEKLELDIDADYQFKLNDDDIYFAKDESLLTKI